MQAADFSMSACSGLAAFACQHAALRAACQHASGLSGPRLSALRLFVERLIVRCVLGSRASEKLPWSGPPARLLRIVYNFRDDTELEGSTLIGTGPDVNTKKVGVLLILIALLATVSYLAGCGGAGSGDSSQALEEQQASRSASPSEQKTEGTGSSGQASGGRLGHPALGDADAPVVLTEYADYQ
jgi:hypothetical protein